MVIPGPGVNVNLRLLIAVVAALSCIYTCSQCAPARRRDAAEIPQAPISGGSCRLRFNEINIFPSGGQQFVELIRICQKDPQKVFDISMEDGKKRSLFKLIFLSHNGYLIGVCDLQGKSSSRHGYHVFYTIGAELHLLGKIRDMKIEDCTFAKDYEYPASHNRFPGGDYVPIGLGLVYSPSPSVISPISLDPVGTDFKKVRIDFALKKKIVENLQDFIVYSSSSPYTHCKQFSDYYTKYNPNGDGYYIIRDWAQMDDNLDYSRSRCPSPGETLSETWLPFRPHNYNYAPASPNSPNICEKSVQFLIEDMQQRRPIPKEDFEGENGCFIATEDNAIAMLNTITHPVSYSQQLRAAIQSKELEIAKAVQAVLPVTPSSEISPVTEDFSPYAGETLLTVETFEVNPMARDAFEAQLEESTPQLSPTCDNFQPKSLISFLKSQPNPDIYPEDILNPNVCSWFEYLAPRKKFRCKYCHQLLAQGVISETKGSKLLTLMMTTGQGYSGKVWAKTLNSKLIKDHPNNAIHRIAEDFFALFHSKKRGDELQVAFERADGPLHKHYEATDNAFVNVFQCIRQDLPFEKYEISAETLDYFDVNVGFLYLNPSGYKLILMSISQTMHDALVERLLSDQPTLSVMIDTSTDISSQATLAIVFHIFGQNGQVEVVLYRILKITTAETSDALFSLFISALREDGLENYVKSRCIGFSSDGGSNVKRFRKLFSDITDHKLASIHCMNHRLELSIKKAWKEILELKQIEELVNIVYSMFHRSAKKKVILTEATEEAGAKEFELKRIIQTRWMATRARAITSIFEHWKPVVAALREIQNDRSFEVDQRVKASVAYQMLLDPYIISTLAFMADVCEVIAALSLKLQERGGSVIGKREKREMLQDTLTRLETEDGPRLELLLKTAKQSEVDGGLNPMTLEEFENGQVTYEGVELITSGDAYFGKLSAKRTHYLRPIVDQIDAYYPADVTDRFDILDPTRWFRQNLDEFGNSDLQELNTALLWNYDAKNLLRGWKSLKTSIYAHKDFESKRKMTPEDFWLFYLNEPSVAWSDDVKAIVKIIFTVQSSTAEVERIYSMYTHTKTPQRYSLAVSTVDAIVRVKFNGPKRLSDFKAREYVMKFLREHSRADDASRRRTAKSEREETADDGDHSQGKQARQEDVIELDLTEQTTEVELVAADDGDIEMEEPLEEMDLPF